MHARRPILTSLVLAIAVLALAVGSVAAAGGRPFTVSLTNPGNGDPDGSGTAELTVNPGLEQVCYTITVSGIGVPTEPQAGLGAAHIHDFATGGIFVDLETDWQPSGSGFTTSGCVSAEHERLVAIVSSPSAYYVNIHTVEFPAGAIQGALR